MEYRRHLDGRSPDPVELTTPPACLVVAMELLILFPEKIQTAISCMHFGPDIGRYRCAWHLHRRFAGAFELR